MNGLASSVNRFRFRIGATVAFDADDARQEASIAMWLAGDDRAVVGYRAILDALRRLQGGFRQRLMVATVPYDADAHVQVSLDTPEAILEAVQAVEPLTKRPTVAKAATLAPAALPQEDAYAALRAEARAASLLYSQAMR